MLVYGAMMDGGIRGGGGVPQCFGGVLRKSDRWAVDCLDQVWMSMGQSHWALVAGGVVWYN